MTGQNNSNQKNLENCEESRIIFENGDYFIECDGKLYKLINDTLVEIITTNSTNVN